MGEWIFGCEGTEGIAEKMWQRLYVMSIIVKKWEAVEQIHTEIADYFFPENQCNWLHIDCKIVIKERFNRTMDELNNHIIKE